MHISPPIAIHEGLVEGRVARPEAGKNLISRRGTLPQNGHQNPSYRMLGNDLEDAGHAATIQHGPWRMQNTEPKYLDLIHTTLCPAVMLSITSQSYLGIRTQI